jgi:hypothetical protein
MPIELAVLNATTTEAGANTYKNEKHEIPGTEGAKKVIMVSGSIDCENPDIEDAINQTRGSAHVGDQTARTSIGGIGTVGCVGRVDEVINSDGTDILFAHQRGYRHLLAPYPVPADGNGKYYITLEVHGIGNANAKYVMFAGSFKVER